MQRALPAILLLLLVSGDAPARPPEARPVPLAAVVGAPSKDLVLEGETLLDVAYRNRLGFDRVSRLNPEIPVWLPEPGSVVRLPTEHVLPDVPAKGLVVNVPEMQLYDFSAPGPPEVFAIAIGDEMDPSLEGSFRIGAKRERPAWNVPRSIRAEKPELPAVVPPGPDNPLGGHWMTIGNTSYGIHGTNNPWSIGREATHGCIRMYNDEIARLYARTPSRTQVRLVYQTVKLGLRGREIVVEVHPDIYGREPERVPRTLDRLRELGIRQRVDVVALRRAFAEESGAPTVVGTVGETPTEAPLD